MREFKNLSNGETDGFALFYIKDGKLKAVLLNEEEATMLDASLKIAFGDSKVRVVDCDKEEVNKLL